MARSTAPIKTRYRHLALSRKIYAFFRLRKCHRGLNSTSAIIEHSHRCRLRQLSNCTEGGKFRTVIGLPVNGLLLDRDILLIVTGHLHAPP